MTTAVFVVVLRLSHRVVDIDRRYFELARFHHLEQTMHTRCGLFGNAVNFRKHLWVFSMDHAGEVATVVQDHVAIPWLAVFEDCLLDAPLTLFVCLTLPRVDRNTRRSDARSGVVLCREDIARRPTHFGAELDECFD